MIVVFLLLIVWIADIAALEVACYHCYGNSTTEGKFCSIDSLCLGQSCYFSEFVIIQNLCSFVHMFSPLRMLCVRKKISNGLFLLRHIHNIHHPFNQVGNGRRAARMERRLQFSSAPTKRTAPHQHAAARRIYATSSTSSNISLHLPDLPIICLECGNVSIGGRHLDVPCAEAYVCQGSYCITKRGRNPHSYCGTDWEGFN
ncbi:hypothetical protein COOONC_28669, partial [Cooperia oncophora]